MQARAGPGPRRVVRPPRAQADTGAIITTPPPTPMQARPAGMPNTAAGLNVTRTRGGRELRGYRQSRELIEASRERRRREQTGDTDDHAPAATPCPCGLAFTTIMINRAD
uniref:Uncharacterized protein n=1 Tax=Oryza sativa subsp. japonica TaxID=39947 RepID=Q6EPD6_ORYSJ|nr:hypothetical protein [Oryza sativa Japonica Group]